VLRVTAKQAIKNPREVGYFKPRRILFRLIFTAIDQFTGCGDLVVIRRLRLGFVKRGAEARTSPEVKTVVIFKVIKNGRRSVGFFSNEGYRSLIRCCSNKKPDAVASGLM
jgi:hypothetical protein